MTNDIIKPIAAYSTMRIALILGRTPRSHLIAALLVILVWFGAFALVTFAPLYPIGSVREPLFGPGHLIALLFFALGPRVMRRYIGWGGWKER